MSIRVYNKQVNATTRVMHWGNLINAADLPGAVLFTGATFLVRSGFDSASVGADHELELAIVNSKSVETIPFSKDYGGMASGVIVSSWIVGEGKDMSLCENTHKYSSPDEWRAHMVKLMEHMCGVVEKTRVKLTVREYLGLERRVRDRLRMIAQYRWPVQSLSRMLDDKEDGPDSKSLEEVYNAGVDFAEVFKHAKDRNYYAMQAVKSMVYGDDKTRACFASGMADHLGVLGVELADAQKGEHASVKKVLEIRTQGGMCSGVFRNLLRGLGVQADETTTFGEDRRHITVFKVAGLLAYQRKEELLAELELAPAGMATFYKFSVSPMSTRDKMVAYSSDIPVTTGGSLML